MASLRRKYAVQFEGPTKDGAPPVTTMPNLTAAQPPAPVADAPKPAELETESPADVAAQNALRDRLKEMERAEALQRQQPQQPPQRAEEPQQAQEPTLEQIIAGFPERVQRWYRAHPEFLTDPEKAAQIQYCHHVARRETGEEMTGPYFDRMEVMLGIAPATNGNGNGHVAPPRSQDTTTVPARPVTVDRPPPPIGVEGRPQRMSVPVSAPPTRESPSMSTGRAPSHRAPLTAAEREVAASMIGPQAPTMADAERLYQANKEKYQKMKANGETQ